MGYSELSHALKTHQQGRNASISSWPDGGKNIGAALTRLQPALKQIGIEVELGRRTKAGYFCTISRVKKAFC